VEGNMRGRIVVREDVVENVIRYWMAFRKHAATGN
jgi:hypothetical protein